MDSLMLEVIAEKSEVRNSNRYCGAEGAEGRTEAGWKAASGHAHSG
jgi:hypothetical protein